MGNLDFFNGIELCKHSTQKKKNRKQNKKKILGLTFTKQVKNALIKVLETEEKKTRKNRKWKKYFMLLDKSDYIVEIVIL